jgi:predicted small metal-binding protein
MLTLVCRETGLDCDYIIKGETEEDILKNGAEHAIQVHGMNANDIYLNRIPANFLCQTIPKLDDDLI